MASMKTLHEKVCEIIKPKGAPVGIKMLKDQDLEELRIRKLEKNLALCQLLKYVALYKKARIVSLENIDACVVGSYVLGFGMPPEDLKERWIKGWKYNEELFNALVAQVHALPQGEYKAALFAPLEAFDKYNLTPDAVILLVNSTQAYLLSVGYFDATGKKIHSDFNGHAACEIVATVIQGKSPWLTIPCGGARGLAGSQDDELWMGMTPEELKTAVDRLESVGLEYPPAIYQSALADLVQDHPLTYLIARTVKK
ncbi:DUF169 domain-containing protein [Thermococcus aggregans]|uniref:DUF169 domain-containing protein n=1 Tax=Thermococcus aggregans TaxID=110163 RepID=A0A9E7MY38_THEAG|nr:DUF169 domain-containing protein [Thermococcus aggregans]USS40927.1 DUF169 domain-containing protein [Thermococcus aggregans]